MRSMRHTLAMAALSSAATLISASAALGDSIEFASDASGSTEGLGAFSGFISYEVEPFSPTGVLTVMLTNTSPADNGGYITGFLFNIASDDEDASAQLTSDPTPTHPFKQCKGKGLHAPPFGKNYDSGAALKGKFLGGGNPADGIAVGETGIFTFQVMADDADTLSAIDFIYGGPFDADFVVRFRGFCSGGSDKVPVAVVPLPAPLAFGTAGLLGVALLRRRYAR